MRVVSTRVLPVPAPASTSTGPSSVSTACALLGVEPGEIGRREAGARARAAMPPGGGCGAGRGSSREGSVTKARISANLCG